MSNIAELRNKFDELGIVYHFYDCHAGHNDEDFVLFNTQVLIPIESKYYKNLDKFREITHYDDYYYPNFTYKNDLKELLFASTLFNDNGIPLADKNELFKEFFLENVSSLIGGYMQEPYDENSIIFDEPLLEKNAKEFKDYLNALGYDVAILKDLKESDRSENYYSRDTYCAVVYANNMLNLKEAFEHLVYTGNDNPKYKLIDTYPSEKTLAHLDEEIKEQNRITKRR